MATAKKESVFLEIHRIEKERVRNNMATQCPSRRREGITENNIKNENNENNENNVSNESHEDDCDDECPERSE